MMLPSGIRVFVATRPVDLRGAHDKLSGVVRDTMGEDPRSGSLFIFINRRGDRLKALFFDRTGDCLLYKRLDHGTFKGIVELEVEASKIEIDVSKLQALLSGTEKRRRRILH